MKTLIRLFSLLLLTSVLFMACQKETSFEEGNSTASVGSLSMDASGNCLGAVVSGTYYKDTVIKASNYVDVSVQVDTAGTYTISSDTVNGYYFKATGSFSGTGTQVVRLLGGGKPLDAGTNVFTVTYNGTFCEFSVTVTASVPTGGSSVFTVTCTGATPAGTYVAGTPLTAANTITINVDVTTAGTWSVTTSPAMNGVIFSGTGTFTTTGAQTIVLTGSGTPTAAGPFTFTVTGATATCTFQGTFTSATVSDYFPRTAFSNWSYEYANDPDDSLLIYVIQPTVTKLGSSYNVFMYNDGISAIDTFGYYRRAGADYYEYGDMSYGLLDQPFRSEFIFLKDNQPVGTTWNSPQFAGDYTDQGTTFPLTLRWEFTILQQNATVAVTSSTGPVSYANTIEVKQELKQLVGSNWVLVGYFRNYFARDKGLVKQDFYDNASTLDREGNVRRINVY
ncbi:MAG TPA: hypothetical protein VFH08_14240 [Chitinophagaceae bacterium]|nr:hypothetical protein [Chitinophagaceae bacterium]